MRFSVIAFALLVALAGCQVKGAPCPPGEELRGGVCIPRDVNDNNGPSDPSPPDAVPAPEAEDSEPV